MVKSKIQTILQTVGDHFRQDVECGVHSGIPHCCILYYCTIWEKSTAKEREQYHEKLRPLPNRPQYVPCPTCLEKLTFVSVKPCKCWHKRYLQSNKQSLRIRTQDLDQEDIALLTQYPPSELKVGQKPWLKNEAVIQYLQQRTFEWQGAQPHSPE